MVAMHAPDHQINESDSQGFLWVSAIRVMAYTESDPATNKIIAHLST